MRVIHSVASVESSSGGPARSITALADFQAELGIDVQLVTKVPRDSAVDLILPRSASLRGVEHFELHSCLSFVSYGSVLRRSVGRSADSVIHDHGLWLSVNRAAARVARIEGVPRIVSPRGMLAPWAIAHKKWKKRIAWIAYAGRDLRQASVVHATSELERRQLRAFGVRQAIAMIPNGVAEISSVGNSRERLTRPYVLFLGRIHQVKGVSELLSAWEMLGNRGWDLVLAGPDEEGFMKNRRLPDNVRYIGMVTGDAKLALLRNASILTLPSHTENFGIVVAESLAAGVPVIATQGTPWECLVSERCGWWVPLSTVDLCSALSTAISTDAAVLQAMGQRGQDLVAKRFSWPTIARQMLDVYKWMLGGGSPPSCIEE